jgi:hypothetical protein
VTGEWDERGPKMWPPELFRPLEEVGIGISKEQFRNPAELDRAHPSRPAESRRVEVTDTWLRPEPLAGALLSLFGAVAGSLRWRS